MRFRAANHGNNGPGSVFIHFQTFVIYNWYRLHSLWLQIRN